MSRRECRSTKEEEDTRRISFTFISLSGFQQSSQPFHHRTHWRLGAVRWCSIPHFHRYTAGKGVLLTRSIIIRLTRHVLYIDISSFICSSYLCNIALARFKCIEVLASDWWYNDNSNSRLTVTLFISTALQYRDHMNLKEQASRSRT